MRTRIAPLLGLILALLAAAAGAQQVELRGIELSRVEAGWRAELTLSGATGNRAFVLPSPPRLVLDLDHTRLKTPLPAASGSGLKGLRSGRPDPGTLRLVFDHSAEPRLQGLSSRNAADGHRLVLEWTVSGQGSSGAASRAKPARPAAAKAPQPVEIRPVVVAIDAGHGGKDPGATGPHGTKEKRVVLALAKELAQRVDDTPGMRAVLTRDGDYFLRLRERIRRARQAKADLFISLHADAFTDTRAKGASVYVLSQHGASSEAARILAERENAADLIGVSLADKDDDIRTVLLDLSQSASIEASFSAASKVLHQLAPVTRLHKHSVQQAGFVVLKSPDVPSMLVETAFISNPAEERRLRDHGFLGRMSSAIVDGIQAYFRTNPPPGTLYALHGHDIKHVIRRGETLSTIARHYDVPLSTLRQANSLHGDRIYVGQELRIPVSDS